MKPRILFSSPCGPYEKLSVENDPVDYFYYRNTYKQKMFQLRSFQSWHSLHFIAQNIQVQSVVLENPSMKQFQKEVEKGGFGIVAIGFTILLTKKVLEMAMWLKQSHPEIEIVLGGYGTAVFKESFETSNKLKETVDFICFGEGLNFMNSLILKKWGIKNERDLMQNLLPSRNSFYRTHLNLFQQIVLIGGLGCTYGCSFCATSSQFNQKYIPLFSGEQLYNSLLQQHNKYPEIQSVIIYEEDFLVNRKQVLEFINLYKNSELHKQTILLTVFASIKSILNYSLEELIDCGIGTIFIGVESLNENVLRKEGLLKRKGEVESMFNRLHSNGVNTLGSLVIGWDDQTEAIARSDSEGFILLNPTFYQVVPLHVVPGTRLWDEMKKDGRISPDYRVELDGISEFNFETKSFSHTEARKLVFETYAGLVEEGGPWPFRLFDNILYGYKNLSKKESNSLINRATIYKSMISPICFLAFVSRVFFTGKGFSKRWKQSMREFYNLFPFLFMLCVLASPLLMVFLSFIYLFGNVFYYLNPKGDQPDYIRMTYGDTR